MGIRAVHEAGRYDAIGLWGQQGTTYQEQGDNRLSGCRVVTMVWHPGRRIVLVCRPKWGSRSILSSQWASTVVAAPVFDVSNSHLLRLSQRWIANCKE